MLPIFYFFFPYKIYNNDKKKIDLHNIILNLNLMVGLNQFPFLFLENFLLM